MEFQVTVLFLLLLATVAHTSTDRILDSNVHNDNDNDNNILLNVESQVLDAKNQSIQKHDIPKPSTAASKLVKHVDSMLNSDSINLNVAFPSSDDEDNLQSAVVKTGAARRYNTLIPFFEGKPIIFKHLQKIEEVNKELAINHKHSQNLTEQIMLHPEQSKQLLEKVKDIRNTIKKLRHSRDKHQRSIIAARHMAIEFYRRRLKIATDGVTKLKNAMQQSVNKLPVLKKKLKHSSNDYEKSTIQLRINALTRSQLHLSKSISKGKKVLRTQQYNLLAAKVKPGEEDEYTKQIMKLKAKSHHEELKIASKKHAQAVVLKMKHINDETAALKNKLATANKQQRKVLKEKLQKLHRHETKLIRKYSSNLNDTSAKSHSLNSLRTRLHALHKHTDTLHKISFKHSSSQHYRRKRLKHLKKLIIKLEKTVNSLQLQEIVYNAQIKHAKEYPHANIQTIKKEIAELKSKMSLVKTKLAKTKFNAKEYAASLVKAKKYTLPSIKKDKHLIKKLEHQNKLLQKSMKVLIKLNLKKKNLELKQTNWQKQLSHQLKNATTSNQTLVSSLKIHLNNSKKKLKDVNKQITDERLKQTYIKSQQHKHEKHMLSIHSHVHNNVKKHHGDFKPPTYYPESKDALDKLLVKALKHKKQFQFQLSTEMNISKRKDLKLRIKKLKLYIATVREEIQFHNLLTGTHSSQHSLRTTLKQYTTKLDMKKKSLKKAQNNLKAIQKKLNNPDLAQNLRKEYSHKKAVIKKSIIHLETNIKSTQTKIKLIKNRLYQFKHFTNWHTAKLHFIKKHISHTKTHLQRTAKTIHHVEVSIAALHRQLKATNDETKKALIKHNILELQKHHLTLQKHQAKYHKALHQYHKALRSHQRHVSHKILKHLKNHHHKQVKHLKSKLEKLKKTLKNTPHLLTSAHKKQLKKHIKKLKHLIHHHRHALKKVKHKLLKRLLRKTKTKHTHVTHQIHKHAFKVEHLSHKLKTTTSHLKTLHTQLKHAKTKKWKMHLKSKIKSMHAKKKLLKLSIHHHKKKLHHFAGKLKQLHIKLNAKKHQKWKAIKHYHKKKVQKHKHSIHKIKNHLTHLKKALSNAKTIEWKLHLLHKIKKAKHKLKHHQKKLKHHLNVHKKAHHKLKTLKVHPIVKVLKDHKQKTVDKKRSLKHKIKLERARKHKHIKKLSKLLIMEKNRKHNQLQQIKAKHKATLGSKLKHLHSNVRKHLLLRHKYAKQIAKLEEKMHQNIFKVKRLHHVKSSKLRQLLLDNLNKLKIQHNVSIKKISDKKAAINTNLAAKLHSLSISWMKFQHSLATKKLQEMPVKGTLTDAAKPLAIKAYKTKLASKKSKKLLEINKAKENERLKASKSIAALDKDKLSAEQKYGKNEKLLRKRFHDQLDNLRNRNTLNVKAKVKTIRLQFNKEINTLKQKIIKLKSKVKTEQHKIKSVLKTNKYDESLEHKQKAHARQRLKKIRHMKIKHQQHVKERLAKKLTAVKTKLFLGNGRPQVNPIPMKKNSKIPSSIGGYSLTFKAKMDKNVVNVWSAIIKRGVNKTHRNPAIYVKPKTHTLVFQSHKTVMHFNLQPLQWNHIAIVRDRQHFSLYINGTLVKSKSLLDSKVHGHGPIYFGSPNKPPALVTLNNVTYYNYPLTDLEIGRTTTHYKLHGKVAHHHHSNWLKTLLHRKKLCKSNKHCKTRCQGVAGCVATCLKQRNDHCKRYLSLHHSLLIKTSIDCAKHVSKSSCILYKRLLHMKQNQQKHRANKRYKRLKQLKQQLKHQKQHGKYSSVTCRKRVGGICLKRIHVHMLNHHLKVVNHHHKLLLHKVAHTRNKLKYKFLVVRSQYWNAKWRQSKVHWAKLNAQYTQIISQVATLKAKLTVLNHLITSTADSTKKASLQKQQQHITKTITNLESKKSKLSTQVSNLTKQRVANKKRYLSYIKLANIAKHTALANKKAAKYHSQQLIKHKTLYKKSLWKVVNHFKVKFKKHLLYKGTTSWLGLRHHDVHRCVAAIKATRQTKTTIGVACRFKCQSYLKSFRVHHCLKVNKAGKTRKHSFHICMKAKKKEKHTLSKKTCNHKCRMHASKLRQKACLPWKLLSSRSYRRLLFLKNKCKHSKKGSTTHVKFCNKYKLILGYKNQCLAVRRAGATAAVQIKSCFKWVQFTKTLQSNTINKLVKNCLRSQKSALIKAQACVNGKCISKYVNHLSKECRLVKQKVNLLYARNECLLARHSAKQKQKLCKKSTQQCLKDKLLIVRNGCLKLAAITTILSRQYIAIRRKFLRASRLNHHSRKQMLSCKKANKKKLHHTKKHHTKKHHTKNKHTSNCNKIIKKHNRYHQRFLRSKRYYKKIKHMRRICHHHLRHKQKKHKHHSSSCKPYYRWIYNRFRLK